jgi:hypothetical protein
MRPKPQMCHPRQTQRQLYAMRKSLPAKPPSARQLCAYHLETPSHKDDNSRCSQTESTSSQTKRSFIPRPLFGQDIGLSDSLTTSFTEGLPRQGRIPAQLRSGLRRYTTMRRQRHSAMRAESVLSKSQTTLPDINHTTPIDEKDIAGLRTRPRSPTRCYVQLHHQWAHVSESS